MVVGNGLVAQAFEPYHDDRSVIIFASGVSNSTATDPAEFEREYRLLQQSLNKEQGVQLVYFSTCSIYNPTVKDTPYVRHKVKMEETVLSSDPQNLVLRLSNVVGDGGNPNTIFNFLKQSIIQQNEISLWKYAERNLLDIDHVFDLVRYMLNAGAKGIINVASPYTYSILEIYQKLEQIIGKKGQVTYLEKGSPVDIDISDIQAYLSIFKFSKEGYLNHLIEKYYR